MLQFVFDLGVILGAIIGVIVGFLIGFTIMLLCAIGEDDEDGNN